MFSFGRSCYRKDLESIRKQAKIEIRNKFPDLIENSSGWYRALDNRIKRLR